MPKLIKMHTFNNSTKKSQTGHNIQRKHMEINRSTIMNKDRSNDKDNKTILRDPSYWCCMKVRLQNFLSGK